MREGCHHEFEAMLGTWHNLFAFNMYGDPSISFYAPGDTSPVPIAPYIILIIFVILTSAIILELVTPPF